ncbi:RecF/RecN/SMC [Kockovaella imperatae]|uniref:Structural maintenance of chromosomes protein n=1 Tax=Kockovaella imperatae TaxID=4999 RepID=A0A1Y1UR94_9TREE|nr:RecF/RecN/SMC [Kockovaella imperatae]ORX40107.1 RecF/RecN/SMC [Kockovaella imperatae]
MYIKSITIQGFKSYRDNTAVEPFSPRHNVVMGRNGSGKSNFFSAIRFVLSDQYTMLSREERQRLLFEQRTSTHTTLSAYVEIVFDNSDGRFPNASSELYLRRTIGLKKDEYSLDKKSASRAEVMNLLESAGFSKSNPYYIVPQGKIAGLTNMSEAQRLQLLKDVAGTQVYEQKREESVKIMDDTDDKREKIIELLSYIEKRLAELEEEKSELQEYQTSDKDRRCLEYALYQRELEEVTENLERIEEERQSDVLNSKQTRKEFNQREAIVQVGLISLVRSLITVQQHEEALTAAKHSLSAVSLALRQYESEMADLVRAKTEIECVLNDYAQANEGGEQRRKDIAEELEQLEDRIESASERLEALLSDLEERQVEEREAKDALDKTSSQLQVLYAKQGRSRQFTTQAARDKFLTDEIKALKGHEKAQQKRVSDLEKDVAEAKDGLRDLLARAEEQRRTDGENRESMAKMGEESTQLKAKLDEMQEQRKDLWREDAKLGQTVTNAREQMQSHERTLNGMMDKDTALGLRAVSHIAQRLGLTGVYGPLYDLFEVSDKYKTAVEVTGGTSLFHVVVDNDDTVSKLLEVMNKEKAGRVTFMPLNRLKSHNITYPKANDAIPMISKLKFDRAYVMAFEQVFGRTIICDDLPTAAQYTRSHGLNAVTVEGDRADRKGSLTGGYHDVRRSRLDAVKNLKKWREVYETDSTRLAEVKEGIAKLEQQVSTTMGKIQVIEARRQQMHDGRSMVSAQAQWISRQEEQARGRVSRLEGVLSSAESELRDAAAKRLSYEEEIKTPMRQNLTADEQKTLDRLTKEADAQKTALIRATEARQKVDTERSGLEIELTENLRRRRDDLRGSLDDLEGDAGAGVLQAGEVDLKKSELKGLVRSIQKISEQVQESEKEGEDLQAEIAKVTADLEEVQNQQMESTRAIMRIQKNADRYLVKRQTLVNRKEECSNYIRDLGVLPDEAFTKYTETDSNKIVKLLHKCNDKLKKFAHVNKKAFEQYNNFTKQRDDLLKRRQKLDASADSIQELIETLDQRKDEAIERTFKQVSQYFEEVFETLVPAGRGQLIMQKRLGGAQDEETQDSMDTGAAREKTEIDNYTGVSIKVSFNSKEDEGQRIQQLSGGQKTLVALATLFAIQKCDPAPFYLFDEIDAALDAQYRTAVANMIHTLSENAQFITTTFRAEMLAHADKFYGVYSDKQKVSTIHTIDQEVAYQFVESSATVGNL